MNVNLLEIVSAARLRVLSLTAETAGYLVLAMLDAGGARYRPSAEDVVLLESGEVRVAVSGPPDDPALVESEVRALLGRLLMLCTVNHPALRDVASGPRSGVLSRELEAALIPVNRAAARRALARTCRETDRARGTGKLDDSQAAREHLGALPPPVQALPQSPESATVQQQPAAAQVPAVEVLEPLVEHTVRIDQLRAAAATPLVTHREQQGVAADLEAAADLDVPAVRFAELQHAADVANYTPVLGSVATAAREPTPDAEQGESDTSLQVAPEPQVERHAVEQECEPDPGADLQHTPAWQPSLRAVHRAVERRAAPPEDRPRESGGFSLLIDEPDRPVAADLVQAAAPSSDSTAESAAETFSVQARPVVYAPRQSDLSQLLDGFVGSPVDSHDVSSELKQLAGIEASPTSQTPPPVGFSEVDAASPTPAGTTTSSKRDVLGRGAGVGLATLASLCTVWLALRAAPQSEVSQLATQPRICRASIRVQDAPANAEIRLRAPAPAALSAPLSAHGSEALFPDLPCNSPLEVLIRDLNQPDGPWNVIPVPAEDLDASTEQWPLQISAATLVEVAEPVGFSER